MGKKYTESDLDKLIDEKVNECTGLPQVCAMLQNETGKKRVAKRVKEIILEDGIEDIDAALAQVEMQLTFEE